MANVLERARDPASSAIFLLSFFFVVARAGTAVTYREDQLTIVFVSVLTMSANSVVRIEALGRDKHDTWKLQMRALLVKNDAWGFVSGETKKPEPTETNAAEVREWKTKDEKAKSDLIL